MKSGALALLRRALCRVFQASPANGSDQGDNIIGKGLALLICGRTAEFAEAIFDDSYDDGRKVVKTR